MPLVRNLSGSGVWRECPGGGVRFHLPGGLRWTKSRNYRVKVFEHPRLEKSTRISPIRTTHRAPAQARGGYPARGRRGRFAPRPDAVAQQKPVTSARLVGRTNPGDPGAGSGINSRHGVSPGWTPDQQWTVRPSSWWMPTDAPTRCRRPSVLDALPNRPPEFKITAPRGDTKPSALEEIAFSGTVWDDFGVPVRTHLSAGGRGTESIELGTEFRAGRSDPFNKWSAWRISGVHPDDLVAWHVWAGDIGPDGKIRRTEGSLLCGSPTVRGDLPGGPKSPSGSPCCNNTEHPATRLAIAKRRSLRRPGIFSDPQDRSRPYASNAVVVRDSPIRRPRPGEIPRREKAERGWASRRRENSSEEMGGRWIAKEAADKAGGAAPAIVSEQAALQA